MTKTIIAVMALGLSLTACGASSGTSRPTQDSKRVEKGVNYTNIDLGGIWKEVTFVEAPDGTPCAVAFNEQATSIDCAWEKSAK